MNHSGWGQRIILSLFSPSITDIVAQHSIQSPNTIYTHPFRHLLTSPQSRTNSRGALNVAIFFNLILFLPITRCQVSTLQFHFNGATDPFLCFINVSLKFSVSPWFLVYIYIGWLRRRSGAKAGRQAKTQAVEPAASMYSYFCFDIIYAFMYYYYGYGTAAVISQRGIFYNSSNAHAIEINFLTVTPILSANISTSPTQPSPASQPASHTDTTSHTRSLSSTLTRKAFTILRVLKHHYHFIFIYFNVTDQRIMRNETKKGIKLHLCRLIHLYCR